MDPSACRVIYIDDRFNTERWISREGTTPVLPQRLNSQSDFNELPPDLQANVNAFLSVFNQVYVCRSGRAFSSKLSELHDQVRAECTPIIACFDVGSESKHNHFALSKSRFAPGAESPLPSPSLLRREITFSSESDESYGLQLLSRIASDLQVDEGVRLIIPVAVVQPPRRDSYDQAMHKMETPSVLRAPYGQEREASKVDVDQSDIIDPHMMLQCLDAGALDVVRSPLDKAGIMGLTVHAYRIYKKAVSEQKGFMASAGRRRKQSWVGVETEKPYAYLREAMVKKLLKGICEPQDLIEDYQHRDLSVAESRKAIIAEEIGKWSFCGHDFSEDELVYAGYKILDHALSLPELENWRMSREELLRFMQGCQVAYNSFVLYHNFRHAVDVLQSLFYFMLQIGTLPPYPAGSTPPPLSKDKSPVAKLLGSFEALTLLISAIGHDVGHPGVNNMFLVKLNAPLAQLYNDQSVLEAFHCAAYSQILRRHWPVVFHDKALRKLMISSILATDMGIHSDFMQRLGNLQEKVHESKNSDGWSPKDMEQYRNLACGLLIKCADISNVARPWAVAEKWTHLLQEEFANQGEMESAVGMETTLFGGPPELGNMLKLANGQIGFMTIFAHPLFANVTDIIPAMGFAANEILTNKGVWFTRAEKERKRQILGKNINFREGGAVSPRSRSPVGPRKKDLDNPSSPLRSRQDVLAAEEANSSNPTTGSNGSTTPKEKVQGKSLDQAAAIAAPPIEASMIQDTGSSGRKSEFATESKAASNLMKSAHQTTVIPAKTGLQPAVGTGIAPHEQSSAIKEQGGIKSAEAPEELSDTRRDNGVSMRAGSASLPIVNGGGISTVAEAGSSTQKKLSTFTFATSEEDEPVRTVDTQALQGPENTEARASAPSSTLEFERRKDAMEGVHGQHTSTRGQDEIEEEHGDNGQLTPTQSTTVTSYTTDQSDQASPTPRGGYNDVALNDRAISAPLTSPQLKHTLSQTSDASSNREGSKNNIHATILANGEVCSEENYERNRKNSTRTIGRRRSRMKLKDFAFWKKNKSDKNVNEGAEAASG